MDFQNKTGNDVYVDVGRLILVKPDEIITLDGAYTCPPLTPLPFTKPVTKKRPKKKPPKGTI